MKPQDYIPTNPQIDVSIVCQYERLLGESSGGVRTRRGAVYTLSPPLGVSMQFTRLAKKKVEQCDPPNTHPWHA